MKEVYLDHAATTYCDPRVTAAMEPYWEEEYGNPSSLYRAGRRAKDALDHARETIARILHCRAEEIIFTGGGTESINLAIPGIARAHKKGHLITSSIEHHAVLHSMEQLKKEGFEITILPVDEYGMVHPEEVRKAMRPDTILVSVMYANNEIGTIQPITEIGKVIKEYRKEKLKIPADAKAMAGKQNSKLEISEKTPFFHVDACQASGALDMDVERLGVDMLSMSASKIYGPKGVGCLYLRRGVRPQALLFGGGQEQNLRSGTENVPGIVGFAKAFEIAQEERESENGRLASLRDYFIKGVMEKIPKVVLNGHPEQRLPHNINISVLDIEGEAVVLYLDAKGIYISTGSACTSTTLDPSHVILAIGRPYEYAHGSLRFTLGRRTTKEDMDYVLDVLPEIVETLRKISPVRMEPGQDAVSHPEAFAGQHSKIKVGGKTYK